LSRNVNNQVTYTYCVFLEHFLDKYPDKNAKCKQQSGIWTARPLKMGLIGCTKTSVTNYLPCTLCNIPEEQRPRLLHGRILKSLTEPILTEVTLIIATDGSVTVTHLYVVDCSKVCVTHLGQSTRQEGLRVEIRWSGVNPFLLNHARYYPPILKLGLQCHGRGRALK